VANLKTSVARTIFIVHRTVSRTYDQIFSCLSVSKKVFTKQYGLCRFQCRQTSSRTSRAPIWRWWRAKTRPCLVTRPATPSRRSRGNARTDSRWWCAPVPETWSNVSTYSILFMCPIRMRPRHIYRVVGGQGSNTKIHSGPVAVISITPLVARELQLFWPFRNRILLKIVISNLNTMSIQ